MLQDMVMEGVSSGAISWNDGAKASAQIAQGIVPDIFSKTSASSLPTVNNSFGGNIATRPVSQAEKESAIRALSNRGYTNEQIQAYIANMGW